MPKQSPRNPISQYDMMKALASEGEAIHHYQRMLPDAETPEEKAALHHIIREESQHLDQLYAIANPEPRTGFGRKPLFTQELLNQIPDLDSELGSDPVLYAKLFYPDFNWTWYIAAMDKNQDLAYGLVKGFEREWGTFSIEELKRNRGKRGLAIERDRSFRPVRASELKDWMANPAEGVCVLCGGELITRQIHGGRDTVQECQQCGDRPAPAPAGGEADPTTSPTVPYHLQYPNMNTNAITRVTHFVKEEKPWRGTREEMRVKFENLVADLAAIYHLPRPQLKITWDRAQASGFGYITFATTPPTIVLPHNSLVTVLHEFKHYLQMNGMGRQGDEDQARGWSLSMFFQAAPLLFADSVRKGRILFITSEDLERPFIDTLTRLGAVIEPVTEALDIVERLAVAGERSEGGYVIKGRRDTATGPIRPLTEQEADELILEARKNNLLGEKKPVEGGFQVVMARRRYVEPPGVHEGVPLPVGGTPPSRSSNLYRKGSRRIRYPKKKRY